MKKKPTKKRIPQAGRGRDFDAMHELALRVGALEIEQTRTLEIRRAVAGMMVAVGALEQARQKVRALVLRDEVSRRPDYVGVNTGSSVASAAVAWYGPRP